ncbi:MAG TPA: type II CAAX endopeptidase family protein, partial [Thermoanaerobaculia bacterium]|nr:type II CAAX endopeptidase family protein [Thermoanaerobaculia bacterium]
MHPRVKAFLLFLLYVVLSQGFGALFGWLIVVKLHAFDANDSAWRPAVFVWSEGIGILGALLATVIVALVGRRPMSRLGYARSGVLRQCAMGSLFGLVGVVLLVGAISALGGFTFGTISGAAYALPWLVAFLFVGVSEEMDFRAAPLMTLAEAIGFWPAAILLSVLFAALHYFFKPMENVADALSVGLLGLFMCFTVLRTGAIWFAIGFHALFDFAAIFLFGAPNSGNKGVPVATKLLSGGYHGPAWLTGGPLGVEAS